MNMFMLPVSNYSVSNYYFRRGGGERERITMVRDMIQIHIMIKKERERERER